MKFNSIVFLLSLFLFNCKEHKNSITKEKDKLPAFTPAIACTLSEITYCAHPEDTITKYLPGWKIAWSPLSVNGNYAFIATDGYNYAVAMRGSLLSFTWDAFDNWIYQDLNIASQEKWTYTDTLTNAMISEGAYQGWRNMSQLKDTIAHKTMKQFLDSVVTTTTPLYFTGHSLGGNLSTVFASWLYDDLKKNGRKYGQINVMTFAAPAAGNASFAIDFNKKFPDALRYENTNDIVPKFPIAAGVSGLGKLFSNGPSASEIPVGYKFLTIKLSTFFNTMELAINGIQAGFGNSAYLQPCGNGTQITIPLSGKNKANDLSSWFAEAGYQHSVEQYARAMGAPVIKSD